MAKLDSQRVKVRVAKRGRDDAPSSGLQGRGLIYIDTDDDVTSIVGKIKAAKCHLSASEYYRAQLT